MIIVQLEQVPEISIEVFENSDYSVGLLFWLSDEFNSFRDHLVVIAPKIVRVEKQKYSAARLVADKRLLFAFRSSCQQQCRTCRTGRSDYDPTLVLLGLIGVFDQCEVKLFCKKLDRLVIISDDQGDVDYRLFHKVCCLPFQILAKTQTVAVDVFDIEVAAAIKLITDIAGDRYAL